MKQLVSFLMLLLFFVQMNLFAQTSDQRAENIQNGTYTIFMSGDKSYYKNNSASDNNPYGYGYWVAAHALETLADAYQRTRNSVYKDRMKSILAGIRKYNSYGAGTYHNDYYDDMEWLCLANFNCYNATKDPEFLDAVHQIWAEIKTGYTNGVMSWRKGCTNPCNNSIANSPAIIIAAKLYQLEGDNANLQMAKGLHAWMKANVFNANGGIWDAPNNFNESWQFSYNSGMFIGACLELSLVTGQQSYIDDGIKASEFMMNFRNYNGGVFFLNETGQGDGGLFKGIFAKWFSEFVRLGNLTQAQKERYLKVINYTGDYAWSNAVNKSSFLISPNWSALPSGTIDLSTQVSGVHLFESVASLNKVHVYQNINYGGFYSQLAPGTYTLAQLQSRGVSDNDITSLTIPIGYTVTVYENDNFSGASKIFTSNTGWLADWNDRISSMKIADTRTYVVNAYQDINYGGYTSGLDIGNYTLAQLQSRGIRDNDITSFKIAPGFKVTVFDGDNFTGASADFTSDINWLADWNDKITSLKVIDIRTYPVNVYQDVNFGGYSAGFNIGDYTLAQLQAKGVLDNDVTSIKVAPGFKVTVYDGDNFTGASMDYTSDIGWIADWNDRTTSLRVSPIGSGNGLTGNYFNGMNFETHKTSRKDGTIDFNWGNGSPISGINVDQFSVRWTGLVQPNYSGEYTFYITNDDGGRLWVNNQLIIDKWHDDGGSVVSGTITLNASQKYEIKLEYYENGGGAKAKLEWSSTLQSREVIPTSQLYANTLPVVSITSPANNAAFTAPASITINANASDAGGSIAKVEFYNGTTLVGSDNSSPYSFTLTNVAAGTYTLMAIAFDNRGGATNSSTVDVKVNPGTVNNAPSVSITSPVNNANYNAPASITINANASDSDGSITNVEFFNGNSSLGSDNSSPYSINWSNVAAGTYTITAKATDNVGAVSSSSGVTIVVKTATVNQAPTVSITSPANNANYNAPASITINANASDNDGSITNVEFFNGNSSVGSDNSSPYSINWSNAAAGTYTITAKATDNAGAVSTSASVIVVVKTATVNQPPTVSITSPANNASFNAPASITFNTNASDADGTINKVEFFNGSSLIGTVISSPFNFTWNNVSAGTYTITAKAMDNSTASTTSSPIVVTVKTVTTNTCSGIPQYTENNGYVAGSKVQNAGSSYQCKPWPYSGWCNGAAWAYAPGTGSYWTDAWTLVGSCTAAAVPSATVQPSVFSPNPATDVITLNLNESSKVTIYNTFGNAAMPPVNVPANGTINITSLPAGIYDIRIETVSGVINQTLVKN